MDNVIQNITPAEANKLALEAARNHVLTTLQELQQWIMDGKDVQNFILIKTNLYTKSAS